MSNKNLKRRQREKYIKEQKKHRNKKHNTNKRQKTKLDTQGVKCIR